MNKKFKKLIILLMFFALFLPINVKAYCNYTDISNLKKLASNINVSYSYEENNGKITFYVVINNINDKIYIKDVTNNRIFNYSNSIDGEITLSDFKQGTSYKIDIYSNGNTGCDGELLTSAYVTLPSYNKYYGSEICKGIEDYSLCQKWVKHTMTWREYSKTINEYKETLKIEEEKQKQNDKSFIELTIDFVYKYYIYIGIGILSIIITIIIIKYVTRDRFQYLK